MNRDRRNDLRPSIVRSSPQWEIVPAIRVYPKAKRYSDELALFSSQKAININHSTQDVSPCVIDQNRLSCTALRSGDRISVIK
jgi:hypothetical protein